MRQAIIPSTGETIGSGVKSAVGDLAKVFMEAPKMNALRAGADLDRAKTSEIQGKLAAQGKLADAFQQAMSMMTPEQRNQALAVAAQTVAQAGGDPGKIGDLFRSLTAMNPNAGADDMRRGLVAGGQMPNENFSPTGAEGDRIATRNSRLDTSRDLAKIFATPVNTAAGATTTFAPNDPRAQGGPVQGRDTLSTAQAKAFNAIPAGQQKTAVMAKPSGNGLPKAPVGYRFTEDGQSLEAIPGGPATKMTAEGAAKLAVLDLSKSNMPFIMQTYGQGFNAANPLTSLQWSMDIGDIGNANRLITQAIEGIGRSLTGAAFPPEEVKRYQGLWTPTPWDTYETRMRKLGQLNAANQLASEYTRQGRTVGLTDASAILGNLQSGEGMVPTTGQQPQPQGTSPDVPPALDTGGSDFDQDVQDAYQALSMGHDADMINERFKQKHGVDLPAQEE